MGVFHQYDIRGIYSKEIDEKFAYKLAKKVLEYTKAKSIVVGYDSRHGNLKLFSAFAKALIEEGINVTHIGLVTRPMLNWVAWKHKYDLGVIITASHNPREYNGFKFLLHGEPMDYDHGLSAIESMMGSKDDKKKSPNGKNKTKKKKHTGKIISEDHIDEYVKFLSSHLSKDFRSYIKGHAVRIIADGSNGAAGEMIKRFLLVNDITYELLYTHPDGDFPGHNPNPLTDDATRVISKKFLEFKADFGFIVDPDADRIRFIDDKGVPLENNYVDCMVIENLLSGRKNKGAAIVHDLISRKILSETIVRCRGKNFASRVGSSYIIETMLEEHAIFGSEMSGHRYFKSMNYEDSGLMMLVYVLNTLYSKKNAGKKLSTLWRKFDKYHDMGELNYKLNIGDVRLTDEQMTKEKESVLLKIKKHFEDNKKTLGVKNVYTIDGISVVTKSYWFNVRPSNTEPLLRLRLEGKDKKVLMKAKKDIEKLINR